MAFILAGAVVVGILAVGVAGWILKRGRDARPESTAVPVHAKPPASSPLEYSRIREKARGQDLQQAARGRLQRFEWVDRDQQIVSLPIQRAMQWLVDDPNALDRTSDEPARPETDERAGSHASAEANQPPESEDGQARSSEQSHEPAEKIPNGSQPSSQAQGPSEKDVKPQPAARISEPPKSAGSRSKSAAPPDFAKDEDSDIAEGER